MSKKKSSYRGIIVFLIIFAMVMITVTVFYSSTLRQGKVEGINSFLNIINGKSKGTDYEKVIEEDKKYIVEYDDKYFTNNIELIAKNYKENVTYYQINGLKDETIEKRINDRLKNEVINLVENENYKQVEMEVMGNFSNILSLGINPIYRYGMYDDCAKCINIDLSTGNDIKFEEIFIKGTSIKELIYNSRYKAARHNGKTDAGRREIL